jgi:hypothetical protein
MDRQAGRDADRVGSGVAIGLSQGPGKAVGRGAGSPVGLTYRVSGSTDQEGTQQQGKRRDRREGGTDADVEWGSNGGEGQGRIRRRRLVSIPRMERSA